MKRKKYFEWIPIIGIYWILKSEEISTYSHLFQMVVCLITGKLLITLL